MNVIQQDLQHVSWKFCSKATKTCTRFVSSWLPHAKHCLIIIITRAKMFSKHKPHAGHQNWPWPSNSSQRGTTHVFLVNLVQIRSAVPEIFHTQTKTVTDNAKNRTLCSSLRAVINGDKKFTQLSNWPVATPQSELMHEKVIPPPSPSF